MIRIYPEHLAILIDFDGTITTVDTNFRLMERYGGKKAKLAGEQFKNKQIDYLTKFKTQFNEIRLTEEEYIEFILTEFKLTEGFLEFYNNITENNIMCAIISGGFDNAIIPFLKKHGITIKNIHANTLIFDHDKLIVKFKEEKANKKCEGFGPCKNCKIKHYNSHKDKKDKVIFIGDGGTDQCVARIADIVFAKGELLEYCIENNLKHIPWQNFNDINEMIFNKFLIL